ncbi:hypothetical protein DJ52_00090 [Brachyspira murdochii]|uniref:Ankyrin n=1 Tax=Brachyspira murdochii TaxID=84378 RepID=A0ABX5B7F9_9SPIR|nr:hypothetical protein DJ52_00090 [Brachyspira murdochii]
MAELLLSYGAYINYQGFRGITALFYALEYDRKENTEMVKLLIKNNADVNVQNNSGITALM